MATEVSTRRKIMFEEKDHGKYKCQTCEECCLLNDLQREGGERPSDCLSPMFPPPPWFDKEKFRRGQLWFQSNFLCVIVSNLVGLLCLLSCEAILKVLAFTRRSSDTGKAYKRYLHTINHVRLWYSQDIFDPSTRASKSIQLVRRMHTVSHTDARNAKIAMPSQVDMVVTQWAFFGLVLTHGPQLGIKGTKVDEEAFVHFWKTIGYLMGIEDRFNLAFGSVDEVRRNCHAVVHQMIIPSMKTPPDGFAPMSDALLDGVHLMVPPVDPSAFMNFTKSLLGLEEDLQSLTVYSRFILNVMMWNFNAWLYIPVFGDFLRRTENGLLNFALFVCNILPRVPKYTSITEKIVNFWQQLTRYIVGVAKDLLVMLRIHNS
ncbi:uncharacterized protein [Macrobrachium rosenbergii]|uniref:uncharacterized protein isoform X1 n=2 Tax=Macrobrachium rosenbergii TaxID=79674 RepID=UPI0034D47D93